MLYQRKPDIVVKHAADTHLLIPIGGGATSLYTLNRTALRLWEALAEPISAAKLAELAASEFQISEDVAATDTKDFLNEMLRLKLIHEA